jgi:hypothetical protein
LSKKLDNFFSKFYIANRICGGRKASVKALSKEATMTYWKRVKQKTVKSGTFTLRVTEYDTGMKKIEVEGRNPRQYRMLWVKQMRGFDGVTREGNGFHVGEAIVEVDAKGRTVLWRVEVPPDVVEKVWEAFGIVLD